jgi:Putative Ig domain
MGIKVRGINELQNSASAPWSAHWYGLSKSWALSLVCVLMSSGLGLSGCGLTSAGSPQSGGSGLSITTASLPAGQDQSPYQATLSASGGKDPYVWSVKSGSLPPGLALTGSTGAITGTATQTGDFTFTIQVQDSSSPLQIDTHSYTVTVSDPGSGLNITTSSLPNGTIGIAYQATLAASGGTAPYSWSITSGSLPPGLTLAASTGILSGSPTTPGTYTFTIQVSDSSVPPLTATQGFTITTLAETLDQYGGREDVNCATVLPYFSLQKVGNRWWYCDALGNALISMSVGAILTNGDPTYDCNGVNTYPIYENKYGDSNYNWGWQTLKRMTSWGFNSVGQDSGGSVTPWETCSNCGWPGGRQPIPLPVIIEEKPAEYAAQNHDGFLVEPIKDIVNGTNSNYQGYRGGSVYDVFDPKLNTQWNDMLTRNNDPAAQAIRNNSPWLLGVLTEDSDWFLGSGAGPDFASGHTNPNIGFVTLITSPVQTFIQDTECCGRKTFLYPTQPIIYTKAQATNPSITCSIANPCSLRDYLWQKYGGSVSALNNAWGSSYTSFDSTGTQITNEAIGTGDGTTKTFTYTLTHSPISPYSVLVSVGGTPEIGDCPWFGQNCPSESSNIGSLGSPTANYVTQSSSSVDYSTGLITITFLNAPAIGTAITVNYIYGGWMAGGTGLMDEDGADGGTGHNSAAWIGTNTFCMEGADPSYPTYFACTGAGSGYEPTPNANSTVGADVDNWIPEFSAEFFKTMHDDFKAVSKVPYLGLDQVGSWGAPPYSKFLEGAAPYVDGIFTQLVYSGPSASLLPNNNPAAFESAYQYLTQYAGDIPIGDFITLIAESDSSMSCHTATTFENFATQQLRGQEYYNTVNYLLNTPGYNGTYQFTWFNWWSWQDFQNSNQGLVSIHDNAYDGNEARTGPLPCSFPEEHLMCGGEPMNYGNVIGYVKQANLLWYKLLPADYRQSK